LMTGPMSGINEPYRGPWIAAVPQLASTLTRLHVDRWQGCTSRPRVWRASVLRVACCVLRQIKKSPPGRRARLSLASRKLQDVSQYSLELVLHAHTEGGVVTVFGTGGIRFIGHLGEVGVDLGGLGQFVVGANRH